MDVFTACLQGPVFIAAGVSEKHLKSCADTSAQLAVWEQEIYPSSRPSHAERGKAAKQKAIKGF
jgi:hypothetical protein